MSRKKTMTEVRLAFSKRGYTLLSTEYIRSNSPLEYLCGNGHQSKICLDSLQQGCGCAECSGKIKKTVEEVRELFESRGFTLLDTVYVNCFATLDYICNKSHQTKISFDNLRRGRGCAECARKKKKTLEEVKQLFNSRGYTLVSKEYKNSGTALLYICNKGHQTKISFSSLQNGNGCSSCANYGFDPNKPATLYYIRFQFEGNFYYKIGITNRTVSDRFDHEKIPYTVINETIFSLGKDAYEQEQAILKEFFQWRYKGKPFLVQGNTELFTRDVLYIDSSILGGIAA